MCKHYAYYIIIIIRLLVWYVLSIFTNLTEGFFDLVSIPISLMGLYCVYYYISYIGTRFIGGLF